MRQIDKAAFEALEPDLKNFYQEKDGAYHFSAVPKTVNHSVLEAKRKAEEDAENLRKKYGDLDPDVARKALEAQKQAEQKRAVDAGEFEKVLAQRDSERKTAEDKIKAEYEAKIAALDGTLAVKIRDEALLNAAISAKIKDEFHDDVLLHGKEAFEVKDGKLVAKGHEHQTVEKWLKDKLSKKKGWLGESTGGGTAKGGDGKSGSAPTHGLKRSTMTLSQKSAYTREHGREAYEKLPYK